MTRSTETRFPRPKEPEVVQEVVPLVDEVLMSDVLRGRGVANLDEENVRKAEELAGRIIVATLAVWAEVSGILPLVGGVRGMKSTDEGVVTLELRANLSDAYTLVDLHAKMPLQVTALKTSQGDHVSQLFADGDKPRDLAVIEMCDVDHEHDTCTLLVCVKPREGR